MRAVVTAEQLRAAEQAVFDAQPEVDLMGRAAADVARVARELAPTGQILVVAGRGNNGGDGLFAAARLAAHRPVLVWCAFGGAHAAGLAAARAAGCQEVDALGALEALADSALVIDAVAGLQSRAGLSRTVETFAEACAAADVPVVAVDLPSGLTADSGAAPSSFRAAATVTFAAPKPCHVQQPAASRCGQLHVVDIGVTVPESSLRQAEAADVARWWPVPGPESDKYSRGVLAMDIGSETYPGAALLGVAGALHAGVGMVRYTGRVPGGLILSRHPSVVLGEGRAQAFVLGSGWGDDDRAAERVAHVRRLGVPAVIDADALTALPSGRLDGWLLTPHAGELARLLGCSRAHVEADPLACVREVARSTGATVLLKGATQYVAEPSGRVTVAVAGPHWTAQAGSGDVLAGICGALLAAGLPAWQAGVASASIQAMTAARNPGPYPPGRLAELLPETIAALVG
ncbi:MAG: NAD(P)H-hydrate epimerase [Arachnia sp.]